MRLMVENMVQHVQASGLLSHLHQTSVQEDKEFGTNFHSRVQMKFVVFHFPVPSQSDLLNRRKLILKNKMSRRKPGTVMDMDTEEFPYITRQETITMPLLHDRRYLIEHSPSRADGVTPEIEACWLSTLMGMVKRACKRLW